MSRKLFLAAVFSLGAICTQAQKLAYSEYGLSVGTLNYGGDIATSNSVAAMLDEVRPDFGIYAMRHFNDWFAMGAEAHYGWFYANDENHDYPTRGLSVSTSVTQANLFAEANFIRFGKYHYDRKFGLYIKAGGGFLAYNPTLTISNLVPENIDLYPNSYSGFAFYGGFGFKFRTSFKGVLRLEAVFHSTGTDHLDGFEYKRQLTNNDALGSIRVSYSLLVF